MVVEIDDENEKTGAADDELAHPNTNGELLVDEEPEDEEGVVPNTNGVLLADEELEDVGVVGPNTNGALFNDEELEVADPNKTDGLFPSDEDPLAAAPKENPVDVDVAPNVEVGKVDFEGCQLELNMLDVVPLTEELIEETPEELDTEQLKGLAAGLTEPNTEAPELKFVAPLNPNAGTEAEEVDWLRKLGADVETGEAADVT